MVEGMSNLTSTNDFFLGALDLLKPRALILKLPFRTDIEAQPTSEYLHKLVISPGLNIIIGAIADHPLDRISVIIEEKDDRLETVTDHRREVLARYLEGTIPHK